VTQPEAWLTLWRSSAKRLGLVLDLTCECRTLPPAELLATCLGRPSMKGLNADLPKSTGWGTFGIVVSEIRMLKDALAMYPNATHFVQVSGDSIPVKSSAAFLPKQLDDVFGGRRCLGITQYGNWQGKWALGSQWKLLHRADVETIVNEDLDAYAAYNKAWANRVRGCPCRSVPDEWVMHTMLYRRGHLAPDGTTPREDEYCIMEQDQVDAACTVSGCKRLVQKAALLTADKPARLLQLLQQGVNDLNSLALRKVDAGVVLPEEAMRLYRMPAVPEASNAPELNEVLEEVATAVATSVTTRTAMQAAEQVLTEAGVSEDVDLAEDIAGALQHTSQTLRDSGAAALAAVVAAKVAAAVARKVAAEVASRILGQGTGRMTPCVKAEAQGQVRMQDEEQRPEGRHHVVMVGMSEGLSQASARGAAEAGGAKQQSAKRRKK